MTLVKSENAEKTSLYPALVGPSPVGADVEHTGGGPGTRGTYEGTV